MVGRKNDTRQAGGTGRSQRDLGQNFLTDQAFLDSEVASAQVGAGDTVLEVGAGPGNLTRRLALLAGRVVAVEYDRQFRAGLERLARRHANITLIWGDALDVALPPFTKVVANLPYRVALPILLRLLEQGFAAGVVIIQKDMAQKICAEPGTAGYGRASVIVQRLARAELLQVVPGSAFSPPPTVDSAIVRVRPVAHPFPVAASEEFTRLLDNSFLHRDEKLGAALGRLAGAADAAALLPARLRDKQVRLLAPEEFGEVSRFLESRKVRLPAVSGTAKRRAQARPPRRPGPGRDRAARARPPDSG